MTATGGRRLTAPTTAAVTVLAGLAARFALPRGTVADIAGDALYAVLVYLFVVFLRPRTRPTAAAVIAGSVCVAIELFQFTGLPRVWAAAFRPIALVLGTGFDVRDIVVYIAAVIVIALVDEAIGRRLQQASSR